MRILWLSNAPWSPSGYGEQTALFAPRFQALGHEVGIAANYGLQSSSTTWRGMPVYPASRDWGNPTISTFARAFGAERVIALCDAWVMRPAQWEDVHMAIWAPVDHWPIPPPVLGVLQHERVRPIAMSRFGENMMRSFKLEPLYVPHGVDTAVFRPRPEMRAQAREALELPPDAFVVGWVAANKGNPSYPRKGFPQGFDAFARFARRHDDAHMYVHTRAQPTGVDGIDLDTLSQAVAIPKGRLVFPPDHAWDLGIMDAEFVGNLYAAFDVLLNPSWGEGFGIPILEAQACGVPVIVSDHSAMTELCGAGWLVTGDRFWDALQSSFGIVPSIASIEEALEQAYAARDDEELRCRAVEFAREYDADVVTERFWVPALDALGSPIEVAPLDGKESRQVRRARARKAAQA